MGEYKNRNSGKIKTGGSVCLLDYPPLSKFPGDGDGISGKGFSCMKLGPLPVEPGGNDFVVRRVYPMDDPVGAGALKKTLNRIRVSEESERDDISGADSKSSGDFRFIGIPWKTSRFIVQQKGRPMEAFVEIAVKPVIMTPRWHERTWPGFSEKRTSDY